LTLLGTSAPEALDTAARVTPFDARRSPSLTGDVSVPVVGALVTVSGPGTGKVAVPTGATSASASLGNSIAGRVSSRTPMTAIAAKMTATCDE
jgi:hypothetical protein